MNNSKAVDGDSIAGQAEQMIGVPFRLHGRDASVGLDCIGLVSASLDAAGGHGFPPRGYRLRNSEIGGFLRSAYRSGLVDVDDAVERGDILLVVPGPAQHHLLIATGKGGFVHAHAGLGRVARLSRLPDWPILNHWRFMRAPLDT